jgi:DNA repair exonuclease SbcCD nuclease subunit
MKIAVCSDLHLEFGDLDLENTENAEVLILGGDIFVVEDLTHYEPPTDNDVLMPTSMNLRARRYFDFIQRCCERFAHVVLITGNHEHYHGDFAITHDILRKVFGHFANLHILDKQSTIIDNVLFFGGTLWTDMNGEDPATMQRIRMMMNDFNCIKNTNESGKKVFMPDDAVEDHYEFRRNLDETLATYPDLPVVVVGHHAPSKASTHPRYKNEFIMNGAYSTNLDNFILDRRGIKLWTHGHTHEDFDYMIGTTRVVCNPRGYDGHEERADHFQLKHVEI